MSSSWSTFLRTVVVGLVPTFIASSHLRPSHKKKPHLGPFLPMPTPFCGSFLLATAKKHPRSSIVVSTTKSSVSRSCAVPYYFLDKPSVEGSLELRNRYHSTGWKGVLFIWPRVTVRYQIHTTPAHINCTMKFAVAASTACTIALCAVGSHAFVVVAPRGSTSPLRCTVVADALGSLSLSGRRSSSTNLSMVSQDRPSPSAAVDRRCVPCYRIS